MWLLVVVGAMVDILLIYTQNYIGIDLKLNFIIASFVAVWLLINELLSILENINDIGVPVPGFLMPIIKGIKTQVENKAGGSDKSE